MPTFPNNLAVAEFDAMERIACQTLDWKHIGQQCAFIEDAHDLILAAWKRELTFAATRDNEYKKHELRALWVLINDEQLARNNGKVPRFMTTNAKREQSIGERCARIRETISIEHFIERECGVELKRNRCRCPVHGGDSEYAFSMRNGYGYCFVCGFSGDVITLAQTVWGLPRPIDAIKRLESW